MLRLSAGVLGAILLSAPLQAQDDPKPEKGKKTIPATPILVQDKSAKGDKEDPAKDKDAKPKTPRQQYLAVQKEFNQAQQDFFKEYQKAKNDEERQKLVQEKYPKPEAYAKRALDIALAHPKEKFAVEALAWVMQMARNSPDGAKAKGILLRDHIESKEIAQILQTILYSGATDSEKEIRHVIDKNPHKEVKGIGTMVLAQYKKQQADPYGGPKPKNADQLIKEAETLLESVAKNYGDVQQYGRSLKDSAEGELFEIRNLQIGKVAPDIVGENGDGVKFKLADYRGKVVVLDFWGNW